MKFLTNTKTNAYIGYVLLVGSFIFLYTLVVLIFSQNNFWDWLHTLFSTLFSVLFALIVGIFLFHHQKIITDGESREQYRILLADELLFISTVFNSTPQLTINFPSGSISTKITYVKPLILEDAAHSGLFNNSDTTKMLLLARMIRVYNIKAMGAFYIIKRAYSHI